MTGKEINKLRKSGRIEQALDAAEIEYGKSPNEFTARSLFWCLYDQTQSLSDEEARPYVARMKTLRDTHLPESKSTQRCIDQVESRNLPLTKELKEITEAAKRGEDITAAYQKISELNAQRQLPPALIEDYAWLTYYAIKPTPTDDSQQRRKLLLEYLNLETRRPSLIHSLILSEALKIEQTPTSKFKFGAFITRWGMENLREEDWKARTNEKGMVMPSRAEKLISYYIKEIRYKREEPTDELNALIDKALEKDPNSQNLPYYKATLMAAQGKNEEALSYLRGLIMRFPAKYYLWEQIANLVDNEDVKIGLLIKAITMGDQKFTNGTRLKLAALLMGKGLDGHAKQELDAYHAYQKSQGRHSKKEYWDMAYALKPDTTAQDNTKLYQTYQQSATKYIYDHLPSIYGVKVSDRIVDDKYKPGKKYPLWTFKTDKQILNLKNPARYGLQPSPLGTLYEIKLIDEKIAWLAETEDNHGIEWYKEQTGTANIRTDRNGKNFAILDTIYIDERYLTGITEGQQITVKAVLQDNGRWTAINVKGE